MKKRVLSVCILLAMLVCIFLNCNKYAYNNETYVNDKKKNSDDYWISATYFANMCPLNFWDSELETIESDFQRIKEDGFNSIIIVVPWREFQPNIKNRFEFNQKALDKLNLIMDVAESKDLGIIIRLGYLWDYYKNGSADELYNRFYRVFGDKEYREAWLEYAKKIKDTVTKYENFFGSFMCWEDFWGTVGTIKGNSGKNELSREYAKFLGYDEYVKNNYKDEEIKKIFGKSNMQTQDIYIPSVENYGFYTFYDFFDNALMELLGETNDVFPDISLEVRADDDLVLDENDQNQYYSHKSTYAAGKAEYTTMVYGIPMGFQNVGEKVSWNDALAMTNTILNKISVGAGYKPIYVDQFLFYDNTQQFSYNAQIEQKQIGQYLENCADTLYSYTRGYGIWTYKDYYFDAIANGEFANGLESWENQNNSAQIVSVDGSNMCLLRAGNSITQTTIKRFGTTSDSVQLSFDVILDGENANISAVLNGEEHEVVVDKSGKYNIEFDGDEWGELSISTNIIIYIDNIKLYNYCQNGLLYDSNWKEEDYIKSVRILNSKLSEIEDNINEIGKKDLISEFYKAELENCYESEEFASGKSIALQVDKNANKQIFMTPNTAVVFKTKNDDEYNYLKITYSLDEEAAKWQVSDGALIEIQFIKKDKIVKKYKLERVLSNGEELEKKIDISDFKGKFDKVKVICNEESGGNMDADWVVVKELMITR